MDFVPLFLVNIYTLLYVRTSFSQISFLEQER